MMSCGQAPAPGTTTAPATGTTAAPAGDPPLGSVVSTLPSGCSPTTVNGVEYQKCGSTYYRAAMQGSDLVYVVSQP